jgi:predicted N-acetyltransferase YhbS
MSDAITIRPAQPPDLPAIVDLHDRVFGPGALTRTAYRVREGTPALSPFCLVATQGDRLIASVRFTAVAVGGREGALLLGPLAVDPAFAGQGWGRQLVADGLAAARGAGLALVLLVGDEPYYGKLGFRLVGPGRITLPGPVDPRRLLAAELKPGALDTMTGTITPLR